MAMEIREYKSSDRDKICKLFTELSDYKRDIDFWVWSNRIIGTDDSIVIVATDGDKVIGHYAILPHDMFLNGITFKSGLGIHAVIHPDYRGKVLMYKIAELAYEIAKERGIKIIYGFPNINYRNIQVKIEGWKEVSLFKALEINSSDIKIEKNEYNLVKATDSYSDLFLLDEVISNKEINHYIRVKKNLKYYRNRYILHPHNLYECFFIYEKNQIKGFIVFKTFEDNKGHIIDYVKRKSVSEKDILGITLSFFKENIDSLILWPINSLFKKELDKLENIKEIFETFLGVKFLDSEFENESNNVIDFSKWELMMGDSDAF